MSPETQYVLKSPEEAVVDDIRLLKDGEPKSLSEDQATRLKKAGAKIKAASDEQTSDDDGDSGDGFDGMTVEDLQGALRERDLPVTGNKEELIQRLRDDEEASA